MKQILLLLISFVIGIGLFVWIAGVVGWENIKDAIFTFTGWQGLVILGLTVLMALVGTWKWREILKGNGVSVSFMSLLNPYLAGFSIMFLAPILLWGGEVFRSYILRERNNVPWPKGMASVIIDRMLEWTANLAVIFFGGLFFLFNIGFPPLKLGIIFGGVFLILLVGVSFFYFKCVKRESFVSLFIKNGQNKPFEIEKEIFGFFKVKKKAMWKALSLSFLRAGVMFVRTWFLILFLGKTIGALPVLSVLGFSYLAAMIPIPTALGSHEAIQTFAFGALGLGVSSATAFTMIIRGAEVITALVGVIIFLRLGVFLIKATIFKRFNNFSNNHDRDQ